MENTDWQTWAAPAVVVATAVLFIVRAWRRRKRGGCAADCGCGHTTVTKAAGTSGPRK